MQKPRSRLFNAVLSKKNMTEDGKKRKQRVVERLFFEKKRTRLTMHFYSATLPMLKEFVVLFQAKQPLVHLLHDKLFGLFQNFLVCFLKPECINDKSPKELLKLDINAQEHRVKKNDMFLGRAATTIVNAGHKQDLVTNQFLTLAETAYVSTGMYMQTKLPITSVLLKALSAIDPRTRGYNVTAKNLRKLPELAPNVLSEVEQDAYDLEIRLFQVDAKLPSAGPEDNVVRIDH